MSWLELHTTHGRRIFTEHAAAKESVILKKTSCSFSHPLHPKLMLRKSAAFTLIELLVVIAIIAILASLAIPALTKAMERSKAIADANTLAQLGKSMAIYLNDNDDNYPSAGTGPTAWTVALNPKYIPSWKPFQSPFDRRSPSEVAATAPVSYGMNTNLSLKSASDIVSATACILMAPVWSPSANPPFTGTGTTPPALNSGSNSGSKGGTHNGGKMLNVLFADTHVSSMPIDLFHNVTPLTAISGKDPRWNN
jgi:prepilin-type N-terminal cleavage/methylation domain-containing protein/prepilin-type processing-associated H-X9-DG protein